MHLDCRLGNPGGFGAFVLAPVTRAGCSQLANGRFKVRIIWVGLSLSWLSLLLKAEGT